MKRRDFLKLPALAAVPLLPAMPSVAVAPIVADVENWGAWCRGQTTIVRLGGSFFSRNQVRDLIATINDAQLAGAGDRILVNDESHDTVEPA